MRFNFLRLVAAASLFVPMQLGATSFFFGANLTTGQEVPTPGISGSGLAEIDLSDDQSSIFVTLFVSGLSGNIAQGTGIYDGPAGQNGPLIFPLGIPFPSFTSGVLTGSFELPGGPESAIRSDLFAGLLYLNVFVQAPVVAQTFSLTTVSSAQYGADCYPSVIPEIRGQIVPVPGPVFTPEPASAGMICLGLGALAWIARMRRLSF
jgi:hypothetical protein